MGYHPSNRVKSGFIEAAAPLFGRGHDKDFQNFKREPHEWYEKLFLNVFLAPKLADRRFDVVVIGPFGCGAFGNDPQVVCQSFLNVIRNHNILQLYKEVHFCLGRRTQNDNTVGGACDRNIDMFRSELFAIAGVTDYTKDLQEKAYSWLVEESEMSEDLAHV